MEKLPKSIILDGVTKNRQPAYRRIAAGLREQILKKKLLPGDQLPSERQLVEIWRSSIFTVHCAVQALVKEGWVEGVPGAGTYVAALKDRFDCAGIYHGGDLNSERETAYLRNVHAALLDQFRKLGKKTLVFMDSRPPQEQGSLLPALEEALLLRRIQCLIFPVPNAINLPALTRVRLPTATLSETLPNMINLDLEEMINQSVRHLALKGCRSAGFIHSHHESQSRGTPFSGLSDFFRRAVRREGLKTRPEWIRAPSGFLSNAEMENYGFEEFQRIWKLAKKPEGFLVYPDTVVRGVIMAVLDSGRPLVTKQMRFVFHRNEHLRILCPFPATWAISDEDQVAAELIHRIQIQFAGELPKPVLLPFKFKEY